MKHETLLLKATICFIGLAAITILVVAAPALISGNVDYYRPLLIGLYLTAVPFLFALHQTLKLLSYIDKNKAFSGLSVKALKLIKYCALVISGLYAIGSPYIYYAAQRDDAPGVMAMGLIITGASFAIAIFAAVLQKLLQSAIAIKKENDLTV